jgi:hypothetical protein
VFDGAALGLDIVGEVIAGVVGEVRVGRVHGGRMNNAVQTVREWG